MKKKNIVVFVRLATELSFWQYLFSDNEFNKKFFVSFVFAVPEVKKSFDALDLNQNSLLLDFSLDNIDFGIIDLVLCQEVAPEINKKFLGEAVSRNIPVLLYEHGALMAENAYTMCGDEIFQSYRADISLASHVACWGQRNKECWSSFGVNSDKLFVTGALQYDKYASLISLEEQGVGNGLADAIGDRKVIFLFSSINHPSAIKEYNDFEISCLRQIEAFVEEHDEYVLCVKPHPSSMEQVARNRPYSSKTILVANYYEKSWSDVVKTNVDALIALSQIVFAPVSSVIIGPLILQKPVVLLNIDWPINNNFKEYSRERMFFLEDVNSIGRIISSRKDIFNSEFLDGTTELVADLACDVGKAKDNFIKLIDEVFIEQDKGVKFYSSRDNEYIGNIHRMPDLPYSYKHLMDYYFDNNCVDDVLGWLDRCVGKFKFFNSYLNRFIWETADKEKVVPYLEKYVKEGYLNFEDVYSFIRLFREKQDYSAADCVLDFLIDRDIKSRALYFYEKGFNCFCENEYSEAIEYLDLAFSQASDDALMCRIFLKRGEAFLKMNNKIEALENFKSCLVKNSSHSLAKKYISEIVC